MLNHSAGLPVYSGGDYERVSRDEILARLRSAELLFPPGEGAEYSNFGYTLAAMIVEDVSGQSYEDYLHTAFFGPLGIE
jgi:CubicO group peptidase (beta-lactamase class C family)